MPLNNSRFTLDAYYGDAISAPVRIMARSLQHRRVAWMHDFRDSPTRRSSHSTNPEVERRRPRRDTAHPNFPAFKGNQPVEGVDKKNDCPRRISVCCSFSPDPCSRKKRRMRAFSMASQRAPRSEPGRVRQSSVAWYPLNVKFMGAVLGLDLG